MYRKRDSRYKTLANTPYFDRVRQIHRSFSIQKTSDQDIVSIIFDVVSRITEVPIKDITAVGRKGNVVVARHLVMFFVHSCSNIKVECIAEMIRSGAPMDHSTVINALKSVHGIISQPHGEYAEQFIRYIDKILQELNQQLQIA